MIDEQKLLAHPLHTAIVLLVLLGIAINNYHSLVTAQTAGAATGQQSFARSMLIGMAIEFLLAGYVWAGVRRKGGRMIDLVGGRWSSWKSVAIDVAIAVPFWLLWTATARAAWRLLGPVTPRSANFQLHW